MSEKSVTFSVRIPVSLREELQRQADAEGRSLSNMILWILKKAVADGKS